MKKISSICFASMAALATLAACGGGGDAGNPALSSDPSANSVAKGPDSSSTESAAIPSTVGSVNTGRLAEGETPSPSPVTSSGEYDCSADALASRFEGAQLVTHLGVTPDDNRDDTDAIEAAIERAAPNSVLLFPAGRYVHGRRIIVGTPGVQLVGLPGATLHATSTSDQAVFIAADRVAVRCFTLTATTNDRGSTPWDSRIAIYPHFDESKWLTGIEITGNDIQSRTDESGRKHGGATSVGIFVYQGDNFKILSNRVSSSLADGIHITGGSRHGEIAYNEVSSSGDDLIGMVSYGPSLRQWASLSNQQIQSLRNSDVVNNMRVHHNTLRTALWGRGISVVGGEKINIEDNHVEDIRTAAGILIAREDSYETYGVHDVTIRNNTVRNIQTTNAAEQTGHAAIEVHSLLGDGAAPSQTVMQNLSVQRITITGNSVGPTRFDGIRISADPSSPFSQPQPIDTITVEANKLTSIGATPIEINISNFGSHSTCRNNTSGNSQLNCQ